MSNLFPPSLWIPTAKDLAADFAPGMVHRGQSETTAAAIIKQQYGPGTNFPIPFDKVLLITRLACHVDGGGAQTCTYLEWAIEDATNRIAILGRQFFGTQRAFLNIDLQGLILGANLRCNITATFSAGAIGNELISAIHGVLVPRGNWQLA